MPSSRRFELAHRDVALDVLLWTRGYEAGVIVYSPMASRLLTGAFSAERAAHLETGDWPAGNPGFTGRALSGPSIPPRPRQVLPYLLSWRLLAVRKILTGRSKRCS